VSDVEGRGSRPLHQQARAFQQSAGNHAFGQMMSGGGAPGVSPRRVGGIVVQPKLILGDVDTPHERQADRVADEAVRGGRVTSPITRVSGGTMPVSPETASGISQLRGGGSPLPRGARARMERAFDRDLGGIRIQNGSRAHQLTDGVHARALTSGKDVFFGRGEFSPTSRTGDHTLAHEIAHTFQQQTPMVQRDLKKLKTLLATVTSKTEDMLKELDESQRKSVENYLGGLTGTQIASCKSVLHFAKGSTKKKGTDEALRLKIRAKVLKALASGKINLSSIHGNSLAEWAKVAPEALDQPGRFPLGLIRISTDFATFKRQTDTNNTQAELACRLVLRGLKEGKTYSQGSKTDVAAYLTRAKEQLSVKDYLAPMVGDSSKLEWVIEDMSFSASEFGKWLLKGGPEPNPRGGKMNCWEAVLFGAYKAGAASESWLRDMYPRWLRAETEKEVGGASLRFDHEERYFHLDSFFEREIAASEVYHYSPKDTYPKLPLAGDVTMFGSATGHTALATGTRTNEGVPEMLSLWNEPDNKKFLQKVTHDDLGKSGFSFFSPKWR